MDIEKLKKIGGSEWQKGDYHRIYFNDLGDFYGLNCNRYNSGNISSANLDGQKISNSKARKVASDLSLMKLWFDVKDGQFHAKSDVRMYGDFDDYFKNIVAEIKARASNA